MDAKRTTEQGPRPVRLLVACGAAATLVGCAGVVDDPGVPTPDTAPAGSATAIQPDPADDPLAPLGEPTTDPVQTDGFPGSGEATFLTDVRVAGEESFDRVVLEFAGPAPEYRVEYVDPPILQAGSGRPVELEGQAFLQVTASPASGVDLSGEQPRPTHDGSTRLDPRYADVVTEVARTGDYENVLSWAIGLDRQVPYGVAVLEDPTRLVVDVRHDGTDGGDPGAGVPPVGGGTADVVDVAEEGTGDPVVLTDVRLGAHDGFDRIVFEFAGAGQAGYEIGYDPSATAQGSGEPVDVPGVTALGITLTNLLLPPDAPPGVEPWDQQDRLAIADAQVVEALITDTLFEGRYAFYAGVTDRPPFAVERFDDPQRLVVDVRSERSGWLGESCSSPAGFSVGHPADWAVNSGEAVPACSRFNPNDFDVVQSSDVRVAATAFSIRPVPFNRAAQERPDELAREQVTVDGRDAVRIERETQDGLYPAGTPITSYAIPLEDGEDGPRTLVADTVGLPGFDYERNVEVLDAQVRSLDLDT